MKYQALNEKISNLFHRAEDMSSPAKQTRALQSALGVVNDILKILSPNSNATTAPEEVIENIISSNRFKNSKVENWFSIHPIYPDERVALDVCETDICQVKFYWLNDNSTKARISAGVMLTPNWEDRDSTQNDEYKVGIDFFLKKDAKSLLMVVSNRGNLRVMEFSDRLTHTQVEILDKLADSLALGSRKSFHISLWDAFALSEVNKKFYEGIAKQFTLLCQHLVHNGKNEGDAKLFSGRLLGRLLFIWFLRKKNVIAYEDRYFPQDIDDSTDYYNSILKQLFFQTFNTPVYDRKSADKTTPYLNGGLFEPHANDWQHERISFPPNYFQDLYEHLNKYNFTTDESSPDYEQVAIDPEMLGRVFESLLAEQRTDSGEQARKAKGTFYTPREIVSYMCKESLRQYLYEQLGDEKYYAGVDKLLDSPDYDWETAHSNAKRDLWPFEDSKKIVPRVIGILDNLTILDPACGSGAFPMGMLQLLTRTYERLDSRFDPYKTKLSIIQHTIFGVDIEPMAVEISRLRAWLAIIVDDQGEIDPLPNLDFKFICADGLIPLDRSIGLWSNPNLQDELANLRDKFFNARKPEMKEKWKKEYYRLTSPQIDMLSNKRDLQLKSFDPFANRQVAKFFDSKYMFGVEEFDVVIGNPPYVHLEKMKKDNTDLHKTYASLKYKTHEARGDLYSLFFERGVKLLKQGGILAFITSNKWMRAGYGESLRDFFVDNTQPLLLIDLGGGVFESATVDTDILILKKARYQEPTRAVASSKDLKSGDLESYIIGHTEPTMFKRDESWVILSPIERSIKEKIERVGVPLKDWDIKINRGILTGCNEAFIINEEKRKEILNNCKTEDERERTDKIIRPILRGRDIKRNGYEWAGLYCICTFPAAQLDIGAFPSIEQYLTAAEWSDDVPNGYGKMKLEQTGKKHTINGIAFASRKKTSNKWYETQDQIKYMDDFSKQKILYSEIVRSPQFYLDNNNFIPEATAFLMSGERLEMLIKYLNSPIVAWIFKRFYAGGGLGEEGYRYKKTFLVNLPLPTVGIEYGNNKEIGKAYGLTDEEINFISSSVNP